MTADRRLVILRHAKAARDGAADPLRPLTERGRRQAHRAGLAMLAAGLIPEVALVSPAIRTRQTAELALAPILRQSDVAVEFVDELYTGYVGDLVDAVRGVDSRCRTVLVVGHEPTMSGAAAVLASDRSDPGLVAVVHRGVPTGSYSVLEPDGPWASLAPGGARLVDMVSADDR